MLGLGDLVTLITLLTLGTLAAPREWLAHPGKHVCGLILLYVFFLFILPLSLGVLIILTLICLSGPPSTDGGKGFGTCVADFLAFHEWFQYLAAFGENFNGVDELIVDWLLLLFYLAPLLVREPSHIQIANRVQDADHDDQVHENDEEPSQEEISDCTPLGSQDDGPRGKGEEEPQQGQIQIHSPIHGYNDLDPGKCFQNADFIRVRSHWALDSGSVVHICNDLSEMKNLIVNPMILQGLTGSVECPLIGDVDLELQSPYGGSHKITLTKCIYYPQLPFNIFSTYGEWGDCGICPIQGRSVQGPNNCKNPLEDGEYPDDIKSEAASPAPTTDDDLHATRTNFKKRKYGDYNLDCR